MTIDRRPYIGRIWRHTWENPRTGEKTVGLILGGASGIAAHLTADEAIKLADKLVDLAERLPQPTQQAQKRQQQSCGLSPVHTSQTLTDASGMAEQPLPATIAD